MASDLEPISARLGSRLAKTVNTRRNVIMNSTPKACPRPISEWTLRVPSGPWASLGVSPYKIPAPAIAPRH